MADRMLGTTPSEDTGARLVSVSRDRRWRIGAGEPRVEYTAEAMACLQEDTGAELVL